MRNWVTQMMLPAVLAAACSSTGNEASSGNEGSGGSGNGAAGDGITAAGGAAGSAAVGTGGTNGTGGTVALTDGGKGGGVSGDSGAMGATRQLPIGTYLDKVKGGWIAQMAAARWMQNMEFNGAYNGKLAPETALTTWTPGTINNAFGSEADETWAEIPYLDALHVYGIRATWEEFGNSWRDSQMPDNVIYSANLTARNNLKKGMLAPWSGHFRNTGGNAENQTWQMESNWTGMVAPGMINAALDINWRSGHVALFGDALNGGAMVTAMQSAAFFAQSLDEIIQAGRIAVPEGSKYREMVEDVLKWHTENPTDYTKVWQLIFDKWSNANRSCKPTCATTLDTKINGAYILLGMLFGDGKFEETVKYAARAGEDGDCTANDAGSIIGTWLGLSKLDPKYSSALDPARTFIGTDYTFQKTIDISTEAARAIVKYMGGSVTGTGDAEVWNVPPADTIIPPILEQWPVNEAAPPPVMTDPTIQISCHSVTFGTSATTAAGVLGYQWYFGDLTHSVAKSDPAATHTYAQPGAYYVIAYVTDKTGNTAWKSSTITIP
jgi:ADP-ribosylglycohydrolase/PKD domain